MSKPPGSACKPETVILISDDILWNNLGSGSYLAKGKASMGTGKSLAKLIGVFGRINYNLEESVDCFRLHPLRRFYEIRRRS